MKSNSQSQIISNDEIGKKKAIKKIESIRLTSETHDSSHEIEITHKKQIQC
jgi:hypothetical protein